MLEIYYGKISEEKKEIELPSFFTQRIKKYTLERERNYRYQVYFHLVRLLQEKNIKLDFYTNDYGKIYLKNNEIYFNISHNKEYFAIAFSDSEVGIDIEKNRNDIRIKLAVRIASTSEKCEDLIKEWTIKESFLKYLGIGMNIELKDIKIDDKVSYLENIASYKTFIIDNNIISVVKKDIDDVIIKRI